MKTIADDLTKAVVDGDTDRVHKLVVGGANIDAVDSRNWTPLSAAAEIQNAGLVEFLLELGADVHGRDWAGQTALHTAVDISIDGTIQHNKPPGSEPTNIIQILLAAGANIHDPDDKGNSPLDWAKDYNSEKIISFLTGQDDSRSP